MNLNQSVEDHFHSLQCGEAKGFNYFFDLYYKPLVHFAYTFLNNSQAAEDVVEDSFVKLWEKRESIESAQGVKPYMYRIVRNASIDVLTKEKYDTAYAKHLKRLPIETVEDITSRIITSEAMHQIFLAQKNLPLKYQKVFNMYYVQGKEIKDIALELNLPVTTVKSQKARALELLRRQLPHLSAFILIYLFD